MAIPREGSRQEEVDWGPSFGILDVDPAVIRSLKQALEADGKGIPALMDQMRKDVDDLAKTWAGPNHDRFVAYFDESYEALDLYRDLVSAHVEMLDTILGLYGELEKTIDGEVKESLKKGGLI